MRKKESWMKKGVRVLAGGHVGYIVRMDENTLDGVEYVYYMHVRLEDHHRSQVYHPSDIEELVVEAL